jgi:branched-chain amino acid transport system substrate-binding protein
MKPLLKLMTHGLSAAIISGLATATANPLAAQKKCGLGASDTEIKIGNMMPYSGPLSAYSIIGKTEAAYFDKINSEGGVKGQKIRFISYDDGFSPPKTFEQARKLVEDDQVLLIFQSLGTPTNAAIQKYMNQKKVPQLFVATGATRFGDWKNFPWTMGWQPTYQIEGNIYAEYLLENQPRGRLGILCRNDDSGKDYLKGLDDRLGGKMQIVAERPYEADATIDSQIVSLKAAGTEIFFAEASAKFAAQAITKASQIVWKPVFLLASISASVGSVLKPAGLGNAQGILTATYVKDAADSTWKDDPAMLEWVAFITPVATGRAPLRFTAISWPKP